MKPRQVILAAALAHVVAVPALFAQSQPTATSPTAVSSNVSSTGTSPPAARAVGQLQTSVVNVLGSQQGGTCDVLVIPAGELGTDELIAVTEDLNVMTRILRNALSQAALTATGPEGFGSYSYYSVGVPFLGQSSQAPQSIYLQGYGALFLMKADFPLAPGPQPQEPPEKAQSDEPDPVWERTRREMYQPSWPDGQLPAEDKSRKYSAMQVENLKAGIVRVLKHAANIRNLAPDEGVTVTIVGESFSAKVVKARTLPGTNQVVVVDDGGRTHVFEGGLPDDIKLSAPTVLTFRAKKSDINALAKETLELDAFRERVQILSYPCLAGQVDFDPLLPTSRSRRR